MADNPRMGVCLDTSFLITLCSQKRENHDVAKRFFAFWMEHGIPMFLPTICYAEYLVRETEVPAYLLNQMKLLPFDPESAVIAGEIERSRLSVDAGDTSRVALKDDMKIIANAAQNRVLGIVTEDEKSMVRYVRRAAETVSSVAGLKALTLSSGFDEGSASFSDPELPLDYQGQSRADGFHSSAT